MKASSSGIACVIIASIIGALAQLLFKMGSASTIKAIIVNILDENTFLTAEILITNPVLKNGLITLGGFILYGAGAFFFVLALRKGELSVIYPLFAANYVWVALISAFYFNEEIKSIEWIGIGAIMVGICIIGWKEGKPLEGTTE